MIQKRSCSLSTKADWNFYDMIKICIIMINNVKFYDKMDLSIRTEWELSITQDIGMHFVWNVETNS